MSWGNASHKELCDLFLADWSCPTWVCYKMMGVSACVHRIIVSRLIGRDLPPACFILFFLFCFFLKCSMCFVQAFSCLSALRDLAPTSVSSTLEMFFALQRCVGLCCLCLSWLSPPWTTFWGPSWLYNKRGAAQCHTVLEEPEGPPGGGCNGVGRSNFGHVSPASRQTWLNSGPASFIRAVWGSFLPVLLRTVSCCFEQTCVRCYFLLVGPSSSSGVTWS